MRREVTTGTVETVLDLRAKWGPWTRATLSPPVVAKRWRRSWERDVAAQDLNTKEWLCKCTTYESNKKNSRGKPPISLVLHLIHRYYVPFQVLRYPAARHGAVKRRSVPNTWKYFFSACQLLPSLTLRALSFALRSTLECAVGTERAFAQCMLRRCRPVFTYQRVAGRPPHGRQGAWISAPPAVTPEGAEVRRGFHGPSESARRPRRAVGALSAA